MIALKMHNTDLGAMLDKGLLTLNLLLGAVLLDHLNLVVAILGMVVSLVVNLPKAVHAVLWIRDLRRNGWKLPQPKDPAQGNE